MTPTRTDFEVRSAAGALMLTTADRDVAVRFAKARQDAFPGIRVEIVERFEARRTTWKPRRASAPVAVLQMAAG